jgi:hypothetical protein
MGEPPLSAGADHYKVIYAASALTFVSACAYWGIVAAITESSVLLALSPTSLVAVIWKEYDLPSTTVSS